MVSEKYFVHNSSVVDDGAKVGDGSKVWHFSHVCKGAKIGENCILGQNVFVGDKVKIALNYSYIFDPLKVITDEKICISFTEPNRAINLGPFPEKDFFHIIMPMQLD